LEIDGELERARALTAKAQDAAARQAYVDVLRRDPTNFHALNELGNLAFAGGFRSAARTAYQEAVKHHPNNQIARVNLANLLREENDAAGAKLHYQAALAIDPDMHEAHQGMAWVLRDSDHEGAERHLQKGYSGHATVAKPHRGSGDGVPLLMLVSARGGNIPTQLWIDDRRFAINAIYADFYDTSLSLPPHELVVNAIGDADLCDVALSRAGEILTRTSAPVINRPNRIQTTGRAEIARRLAAIPGVITPRILTLKPAAILDADDLRFPLLLRRPGFHTGEHFVHVASRDGLPEAIASLAGEQLLVISYLDARGADGMSRKYRVMFVDGIVYPLHLAVSADWKVHYFSSNMAQSASFREEERRFLEDMPGALGTRAMQALRLICTTLDLEYAGVDFALAPDGSVLLFEANATMVVFPPGADPIWDYRRRAIDDVLQAATRMLLDRAGRDFRPRDGRRSTTEP
jgi:glutathione synthase/RimK-type ligase-like ATP-grasp enzyme